jgi:hypothetical protein
MGIFHGVLLEQAIESHIPFATVLMDSWYLLPDLIQYLKDYDRLQEGVSAAQVLGDLFAKQQNVKVT